jgi:hypothetical protein
MGNGLSLDGGRFSKTCLSQISQQGGRHTKGVKTRKRSRLHAAILSLWIALRRDQRTEGRVNPEGVSSKLDLVAMRSRGPR